MEGLRKRCSSAVIGGVMVAMAGTPAQAAGGSWRAPAGAWGASGSLAAPASRAGDTAPAAVVGLDADAPEQGAALTRALRRAFAARGLSGGEEVNLSELRLALGCKGSSPECLARGGPRLGARRLIYGTLRRGKGEAWSLEVTLLEVEGGATTTITLALTEGDLAADRIDATATSVADRLAPDTAISAAPGQGPGELASPPPPPPDPPADDGMDDAEPEADAGGRLKWGWVKPQPRWKWAGFGVGAGLTVVGFGVVAGTGVWLRDGFRKELLDAANRSLEDDNPLNDVNPNQPETVNLCAFARSRPTDESGNPLGAPGQVRNSAVMQVCNKGDMLRATQVATTVVGGLGAVTTVVFTILLFVHREPARSSAWRRRGMVVGMDPVRGQGLSLRVAGRF